MTAAAAAPTGSGGQSGGQSGGPLAALKHRDFALFFSAALCSNTGTWMQTITVPYVLDQLTHSTVWVGVGAFATFFPATVVGPLAGALADRHDRRTILLISQVILMASALTLWGIWVTGVATPPLIVAVVVVGAIGAGITIAAWQAFVPQLVPPEAMVTRCGSTRCSSPVRGRSDLRWPAWSSPISDPAPRSSPTPPRSCS